MISNSKKERRRTSVSGEMVEEEMEKGWGSLARGGRKASLPVLTSYKRLSVTDSMDTVDSRIHDGEGSSGESSVSSRRKRREEGSSGLRERKSTPTRFLFSLSLPSLLNNEEAANVVPALHLGKVPKNRRVGDTSACQACPPILTLTSCTTAAVSQIFKYSTKYKACVH